MGRAAEAVLSAASRRSRSADVRRQTSSIRDTGVRAIGEPPDMRHVSPDRSGTPQPATEAASSEEPSGNPTGAVSPSRMRSENRSDFDPSRQRRHITRPDVPSDFAILAEARTAPPAGCPPVGFMALRLSPNRPSLFRSRFGIRSGDLPPHPHRPIDGPSRCLRAVFIFRIG